MNESPAAERLKLSYLSGTNSAYIEDLYEQFLVSPGDVSEDWRQFFSSLPAASTHEKHSDIVQQLRKGAQNTSRNAGMCQDLKHAFLCWQQAVRRDSVHVAQTNPLQENSKHIQALSPQFYGLSTEQVPASLTGLASDLSVASIDAFYRAAYQGAISIEAAHIEVPERQSWLWQRLETFPTFKLSADEQSQILRQLMAANGMEQYLARKFVAQKRFSLEGGDALIPMLEAMIAQAVQQHDVQEIVMSMAHRGRLNVMTNVFGVPMQTICQRFTGEVEAPYETSGDVKYHLGCSTDRMVGDQSVHLSLACNPSHLEFVNPVLQGMVRGKQQAFYADNPGAICAITMHGDASVCGQGIVPETLHLMRTPAHNIGGGIHIVVNNQVGHSVSDLHDMTACHRITDIFKAFDLPIIHVNADDPNAVIFAAQMAIDYWATFAEEVVIDLVCYRRLGHNEADEPSVTQPMMYKGIHQRPRLFQIYADQLTKNAVLTESEIQSMQADIKQCFESGASTVETHTADLTQQREKIWSAFTDVRWDTPTETQFPLDQLKQLAKHLQTHPEGFVYQKQIQRLISQRQAMLEGDQLLNWGMAELLAYASLMQDGYDVRLVGQDVRRGTFSHRQAVLHDFETGSQYNIFQPVVHQTGRRFDVYDSVLAEGSVLGAEYGFSTTNPNTLVLWEAQFGDFANSAQVIIDQFISSAWQKWQQLSHLVMLLPHGYEGQGPEHSSARLERYLQLAAQHSIQVCVPTTPAQQFHLLRRQILSAFRRPLIIMSPKSLLRHPESISSFEDLSEGQFKCVLNDQQVKPEKVKRVVLCSGKIYFELLSMRQQQVIDDVALIRVEQLYPFPYRELREILATYSHAETVLWCQEEPRNQGAWFARRHCFEGCLAPQQKLQYVGRDMFASTAAGSPKLHKQRQAAVIAQALGLQPIELIKYE